MQNIFPISFNKVLFADFDQPDIEDKRDSLLINLNNAITYYNQHSGKEKLTHLDKLNYQVWKTVNKKLSLFFHPDKCSNLETNKKEERKKTLETSNRPGNTKICKRPAL